MNRADFQNLAEVSLQEAKVLLDADQFGGAYYLAGYAVECALKACICKQTKEYDFPPNRNLVNECYSHNIETLLKVAGLTTAKEIACATDPILKDNWKVAFAWNEQSRYIRRHECGRERALSGDHRPHRRSSGMDQIILVDSQLDDGRILIDELSRREFEIAAAFWITENDENLWHLSLASPLVEQLGGREARMLLETKRQEIPELRVEDSTVRLIGTSDRRVKEIIELRDRYSTRFPIPLYPSKLGGAWIDRGYIYPVLTSAARATQPASPSPQETAR